MGTVKTTNFEPILCLVVLINIMVIIAQTDAEAGGDKAPSWMRVANMCFLCFYVVELMVRFWIARSRFFMHIVDRFPELHMIVHGIFSSFKALFWGCISMLCVLLLWSIAAVQIVNPINIRITDTQRLQYEECEYCEEAFTSVPRAFLTFVQ